MHFIASIYSKINTHSHYYLIDKNKENRKNYKNKIIRYTEQLINIINKLISNEKYDEPLIYTKYIKEIIILSLTSYAQVFIHDKNFSQLRIALKIINDIISKLNIEKDFPYMAYINKIKGDYWFFNRDNTDINAAITYYEGALDLLKENSPKTASILYNIGYAYFIKKNTSKAFEYLNRCINEYNKILLEKNTFGYFIDIEDVNNKIYSLKKLIAQLSSKR